MNINVIIDLGDVDFDVLETDADFDRVAESLLPTAVDQMGEAAGEAAWNDIHSAFKGTALQVSRTDAEKRQFVADAARQFRETATPDDKKEITDTIVSQLREQKAEHDSR